jgi:hypothetical protein
MARRFAFTHSDAWYERNKMILEQAKRLAPEIFIKTYAGHELGRTGRIAYSQSGDARSVIDTLEGQIIVPLLSPHFHPWVRYGINLRIARYYRKRAHRTIRHLSKQQLNHGHGDFYAMLMPTWYEHWNRWNIA